MSNYNRSRTYDKSHFRETLPSKPRPTSTSKSIKNHHGVSPQVPHKQVHAGASHGSRSTYTYMYSSSVTSPGLGRSQSFGGTSSDISNTFAGHKSSYSNGPKITRLKDTEGIGAETNKVKILNEFDKSPLLNQYYTPSHGRRSSSPDRKITPSGNVSKTSSMSSNTSSYSTGSDRFTSPPQSPYSTNFKTPTRPPINGNSNNSNESLPPPPYDPKSNHVSVHSMDSHLPSLISDQKKSATTIGQPTSGAGLYTGSDINRRHSTPLSGHNTTTITRRGILSSDKGLVGLRNLGNTCYMNSILQCLSATESLTELLLRKEKELLDKAKKNGIVKAYIDLLSDIWIKGSSISSAIAPMAFKQKVQRLAPMFQGYDQHDSQELLRFLLSGLHDELNAAQSAKYAYSPLPAHPTDKDQADHAWKRSLAYDDSVISKLFMGQLKSTLKCQTCDHISVTFDPFWDLSLPIPSQRKSIKSSDIRMQMDVSLDDCFKLFTAKEKLDNDNKPMCDKCQSLQPATKQLSIQKYPSILVLHLKRFSGVHYRTKLSTLVKFKEDMSLPSNEESDACYQLYAISNHSGSCYGGHYTAYCKHPVQGKWYQLNDSSIAPVSNPSIVSNQAYVLFYKKKS